MIYDWGSWQGPPAPPCAPPSSDSTHPHNVEHPPWLDGARQGGGISSGPRRHPWAQSMRNQRIPRCCGRATRGAAYRLLGTGCLSIPMGQLPFALALPVSASLFNCTVHLRSSIYSPPPRYQTHHHRMPLPPAPLTPYTKLPSGPYSCRHSFHRTDRCTGTSRTVISQLDTSTLDDIVPRRDDGRAETSFHVSRASFAAAIPKQAAHVDATGNDARCPSQAGAPGHLCLPS